MLRRRDQSRVRPSSSSPSPSRPLLIFMGPVRLRSSGLRLQLAVETPPARAHASRSSTRPSSVGFRSGRPSGQPGDRPRPQPGRPDAGPGVVPDARSQRAVRDALAGLHREVSVHYQFRAITTDRRRGHRSHQPDRQDPPPDRFTSHDHEGIHHARAPARAPFPHAAGHAARSSSSSPSPWSRCSRPLRSSSMAATPMPSSEDAERGRRDGRGGRDAAGQVD
jgi:hypothetical protein